MCPFDFSQWTGKPPVQPIPAGRVLEKLDECYSRGDLDAAVRLAEYWIREAKAGNDLRGEFAVSNELMGIFRKLGRKDSALSAAERSLELIALMDMQGSVTEGTALVNAATVCRAFDMPEKSLELFESAVQIYENGLPEGDDRLAGLYNNMAVTLCSLGRFGEAEELLFCALEILGNIKDSEGEQAVSWLNLADLYEAQKGPEGSEEDVRRCCIKAVELLDSPMLPRDGNYAFYCEKCAPVLAYYGFFEASEDLSARAEEIYNR